MNFFEQFILNHFPDIILSMAIAFITLVAYGMIMS